jgi:hypothetical protein
MNFVTDLVKGRLKWLKGGERSLKGNEMAGCIRFGKANWKTLS